MYEIYKVFDEKEKLLIIDTKYFPDTENKDVYYDRKIAFEIYDNMLNLEENVINSFPELIEFYQNEIFSIQEKIERLKAKDKNKYKEDINAYKTIGNSEILKKMQDDLKLTKQKNLQLKSQIIKANDVIRDLSYKLEISLNRVEELQSKKNSKFERMKLFFKSCLKDSNKPTL